jgi:hypothetical protein
MGFCKFKSHRARVGLHLLQEQLPVRRKFRHRFNPLLNITRKSKASLIGGQLPCHAVSILLRSSTVLDLNKILTE